MTAKKPRAQPYSKPAKQLCPIKIPQAPSYLQKKTNVTLFSDKAIKKPKPFLPDAVERPQGLSGSIQRFRHYPTLIKHCF